MRRARDFGGHGCESLVTDIVRLSYPGPAPARFRLMGPPHRLRVPRGGFRARDRPSQATHPGGPRRGSVLLPVTVPRPRPGRVSSAIITMINVRELRATGCFAGAAQPRPSHRAHSESARQSHPPRPFLKFPARSKTATDRGAARAGSFRVIFVAREEPHAAPAAHRRRHVPRERRRRPRPSGPAALAPAARSVSVTPSPRRASARPAARARRGAGAIETCRAPPPAAYDPRCSPAPRHSHTK